ncbi:hypothetical protein TNCV_1500261 [Trichonephila clavipes]|nr:hypothetical protein TNCV_1500261 [Trichonephila clavipes]
MRTRPCVCPLRFSLQNVPVRGSKVSVGVGRREICLTESDKTQKTIGTLRSPIPGGERKKDPLPLKSQAVQDVIWRGLLSLALDAKSKSLPASTKGKTLCDHFSV